MSVGKLASTTPPPPPKRKKENAFAMPLPGVMGHVQYNPILIYTVCMNFRSLLNSQSESSYQNNVSFSIIKFL